MRRKVYIRVSLRGMLRLIRVETLRRCWFSLICIIFSREQIIIQRVKDTKVSATAFFLVVFILYFPLMIYVEVASIV